MVNNYNQDELEGVFRKYGEENNSRQIAEAIVIQRKKKKIETVGDLVAVVMSLRERPEGGHGNLVSYFGKSKIHPATRIFQALRIEVNDELEVLRQALPQAIEVLQVGGRLAVISFHSLEDRIVKQYFQKQALLNNLKIINKKPIVASAPELKTNPKARSAKLRIIEKA